MIIYVLHDLRRPDEEWVNCVGELERQGIEHYIMMPAITGRETVAASINASHKLIVQQAKEAHLPEVCIMESDVLFPAKDGWEYFLKNKPACDVYFGGVYEADRKEFTDQQEMEMPMITKFSGMHCYIIDNTFYDTFLSLPDNDHIDTSLFGRGVFRVCYPFAAIQRPGWSANNSPGRSANDKQDIDYNTILRPEDVYGW